MMMSSVYKTTFKAFLLCAIWLAGWTASVSTAEAASLSLSPTTGVYTAGGTFTANVVVNTAGSAINAAEATLSFKPNELQVVRVTKGSIFGLWTTEPTYSNSAGTISFGGGSPGGYTGAAGTVVSITFRAVAAGTTRVNFSSGSVLAADGRGTNVLTNMSNGNYTIAAAEIVPEPEVIEYIAPANTPAAPVIRSSTHADSQAWYQERTAQLSWTIPNDVTAVRTLLDRNSGSIPTKVYEPAIAQITLPELDEGVQYFHLQFRNAEGWGRVAHYRLAVDTSPPQSFTIALPEAADLSNPIQTLLLDVDDAISPVTTFMVQIDGAEPFEYKLEAGASSSIELPPLDPGRHTVIIEAFDAAGNSIADTFSFTITAFDRPTFTEYPTQLTEGVIPVIKGQTRPRSEVTVTLSRIGVEPTSYLVPSDGSGQFIFIPEQPLATGVYELVAVAVDEYGAQSEPSETVRIAVQQPGYLQIGSYIVSVLSVIVPLTALVLLLGAIVWYVVYRWRRLRRRVARESGEAAGMLDSEFARLLSLLDEQEAILAAARRTRKLSKAEAQTIAVLREGLHDAQRRVAAEIEDVEQIVSKPASK